MRPTVAEERAHAIAEQLDEWELTAGERRALETKLATPWRRNGTFVALSFFGLTVFAMFALTALCKSIGATEFAAAFLAIGFAEYLIRKRQMYGSGVESALWIGGLLAFIAGLPSSGAPEWVLIVAAAFGLAAWRMQNALFGTIGVIFAAVYPAAVDHSHDYWRAALLPLGMALAAVVAKWWTYRRPWLDSLWSMVAIVMPLVAEIAGDIATYDSRGYLERAAVFAIAGTIALLAGLHLGEHALLIASGVSFAVTAYEAHDLFTTPLEWKLIAGGLALLALAGVVARALRGRTEGLVATPARLTRFDEVVKLGATMVAGSATHENAAASDPGLTGTSGGAGSFGGAGATSDY